MDYFSGKFSINFREFIKKLLDRFGELDIEMSCVLFSSYKKRTKQNMKKVLIFLLLVIITISCKSQSNEFSLIGKWQAVESSSSDGAKTFTHKVKNGEIFIFDLNNIVKDKLGNIGKYSFQDEKLHIELANQHRYYKLYYEKDNPEQIFLNPVTSDYQIICDEGCAFVYEKIN